MQMTQVLADISSKTATPITRATGAAAVTTTAGADTGIMTTEVATVATKIIDGDGTDRSKRFLKRLQFFTNLCAASKRKT